MKKFWVVLLSLGLVMAFSMSAFAVSANFTGQYYLRQNYYSNPSLLDQNKGNNRAAWANTDQRLRLFTRLKVVEGVDLTVRTDILETVWGKEQGLYAPSTVAAGAPSSSNMRTFNEQNASFEQLYLTFATGIGKFIVGNRSGVPFSFGTFFLNSPGTAAGITWTNTFGPLTVIADLAKTSKGDMAVTGRPNLLAMDRDRDYYDLGVTYKGKGLEAGLMTSYFRWANTRTTAGGSISTAAVLDPYFKGKFGPVDVEAEAYYMRGKVAFDEPRGANLDQDIKAKGLYLNGKYNMGPAYVGGSFIYTSGADPAASPANGQDITGGMLGAFGYANDNASGIWSIYLPNILYGYASDTIHVRTPLSGRAVSVGQVYDNLWLYNIYGGMAVNKKLSFDAKFSLAKLDKVDPAVSSDDSLGKEINFRATYKIYDALTYNVGAAYLWTGDYYKGVQTAESVENTYFLTHWLDLRF